MIYSLLFASLLFMMALSSIVLSGQRSHSGIAQFRNTQALYWAEAGLAIAKERLEDDLSWPGGEFTEAGKDWSLEWGTGKNQSVNNIGKLTATASYRGPETVPPNSALLIIRSKVGEQTYVLEALVLGTGAILADSDAILANGAVHARGDLRIQAVNALDDASEIPGSLQSNAAGNSDLVTWRGEGDEKAVITGKVQSASGHQAAVSMAGAEVMGGIELSTSSQVPQVDIISEVTNHSTFPSAQFTQQGENGLEPAPITGKVYFKPTPGQANVPMDLVLDGGVLYVQGDLEVLGSIKGRGQIYVTGATSFRGDAEITSQGSASIFSNGSVELTGFDGTAYLESLPGVGKKVQEVSKELTHLESLFAKHEIGDLDTQGESEIWLPSQGLGLHLPDGEENLAEAEQSNFGNSNLLGDLKQIVNNQAEGPTRDFVGKRLEALQYFFSSADDIEHIPNLFLDKKPNDTALLDAILIERVHGQVNEPLDPAILISRQFTLDKIGTSSFQGTVYTNGYFYADNEVNVLGTIVSTGSGSGSREVGQGEDAITLNPGDVFLGNKTSLTSVREFLSELSGQTPSTGSSVPQKLENSLWMGR